MNTTKLEKLNSCSDAIEYFRSKKSYKQGWEQCPRGDWMLWIAKKINVDNRKLTLAKGLCANTVIHLMKDQRSKDAVKAAIDYGNGLIDDKQLKTAAAAAAAAYAAAAAAAADAYAAYAAAAAADAAFAAYAYAAAAAAAADDAYAARKENQKATADICREVLTNEIFKLWNKLK